jgi:hypothetical protein
MTLRSTQVLAVTINNNCNNYQCLQSTHVAHGWGHEVRRFSTELFCNYKCIDLDCPLPFRRTTLAR